MWLQQLKNKNNRQQHASNPTPRAYIPPAYFIPLLPRLSPKSVCESGLCICMLRFSTHSYTHTHSHTATMFAPALLRTARPAACRIAPIASRLASSSTKLTIANENFPLPTGEEVDPQLNGYPQLPNESLQNRYPFGWWDIQERKNFGEVVHESEDVLGMWGPDVHKTSWQSALLQLCTAFGLVGAVSYVLIKTRPERPAIARDYPYGGLEKELGGINVARKEQVDEE
ncbi:NADH dehydrogenase (ubiquinone) 1 beta subcomplex 8 [Cryptococcus neoformans C23]|nr:NADH dehydrogenase (ubiquinone) 1 beta subcomplex 8 [Cryptococcus neoformans var. grubii AD2-60a]OWZ48881.1 NADH dehydrogenase (ubiquinone) 1 beta subcomplex 8 [Cryptococcus neoformans var. grubii C23]OWZ58814.1 NADH dehydrogenase (ubiquinone) 1 beta subcomplex 8 [Cryptococcus neoformans var. grubii 125.91]OXG54975.1 NADH dehydrogenase (ubiquinone) 1 beta subcomplex 8 [Cryptococcus neoformans var. grubii Th84]OXG93978.1 NADH dehydrogenase (ubiquinone) 1 beta subcomplex 8 [Cryptococcus neofor